MVRDAQWLGSPLNMGGPVDEKPCDREAHKMLSKMQTAQQLHTDVSLHALSTTQANEKQ